MKKQNILREEPTELLILKQKNIHLKSELTKYKDKVQDYQENYHYSQLEKLKMENLKLTENKQQMEADKEQMLTKLNEYNQQIVALSSKEQIHLDTIKSLKQQNQESKQIIAEMKTNEQKLHEEMKENQLNALSLQNLFAEKNKSFDKLQAELDKKGEVEKELNYHIHVLKEEFSNTKIILSQVEAEKEQHLKENQLYKKEIENQQSINKKLQAQVDSLQKELEFTCNQQGKTDDELLKLQQTIGQLEDDKIQLQNQINSLQKELELKCSHQVKTDDELLKLQQTIGQLEDDKIQLQNQITSLQKELELKCSYQVKTDDELLKLHQTIGQLEEDKIQLQNQISSLQKELDLKSSNQVKMDESLLELQQTIGQLEDDKIQLQNQINSLKEEFEIICSHKEKSDASLLELQQTNDQLVIEKRQLQDQVISIQEELDLKCSQQEKADVSIQELQQTNKLLDAEKKQLYNEKESLEAVQTDLLAKINTIKEEIRPYKTNNRLLRPNNNSQLLNPSQDQKQQIYHLKLQVNEYGEKITSSLELINQLEEHIETLSDELQQLKSMSLSSSTNEPPN